MSVEGERQARVWRLSHQLVSSTIAHVKPEALIYCTCQCVALPCLAERRLMYVVKRPRFPRPCVYLTLSCPTCFATWPTTTTQRYCVVHACRAATSFLNKPPHVCIRAPRGPCKLRRFFEAREICIRGRRSNRVIQKNQHTSDPGLSLTIATFASVVSKVQVWPLTV